MKFDGFVKSRIFPFIWIPAYAGMTIKHLISIRYTIRHTRECGYPDVKKTFYEFMKFACPFAKRFLRGLSYLIFFYKFLEKFPSSLFFFFLVMLY